MKRLLMSMLLVLPCAVGGCGDDEDDDFSNAEVTDMDIQDEAISVGEGTVVAVEFDFDRDDVDDGDEVVVVVRLPNGIAYRDGTSEIDTTGNDDDVGAQVTICGNGETYLLYDLDENDLDNAEDPSGEGEARLTLTVDGISPQVNGFIQAKANQDSVIFSCATAFFFDEQVGLTVF